MQAAAARVFFSGMLLSGLTQLAARLAKDLNAPFESCEVPNGCFLYFLYTGPANLYTPLISGHITSSS